MAATISMNNFIYFIFVLFLNVTYSFYELVARVLLQLLIYLNFVLRDWPKHTIVCCSNVEIGCVRTRVATEVALLWYATLYAHTVTLEILEAEALTYELACAFILTSERRVAASVYVTALKPEIRFLRKSFRYLAAFVRSGVGASA